MTLEEAKNKVLIACLAAQILHEVLDDLEDTDFGDQKFQNATTRIQKELEKHCDPQINELFKVSPEAFNELTDSIEMIGKLIAKIPDALHLEDVKKILKGEEKSERVKQIV